MTLITVLRSKHQAEVQGLMVGSLLVSFAFSNDFWIPKQIQIKGRKDPIWGWRFRGFVHLNLRARFLNATSPRK